MKLLQMMEEDHRVDNTWAAAMYTEEQTIRKKMVRAGESGAVGSRPKEEEE